MGLLGTALHVLAALFVHCDMGSCTWVYVLVMLQHTHSRRDSAECNIKYMIF